MTMATCEITPPLETDASSGRDSSGQWVCPVDETSPREPKTCLHCGEPVPWVAPLATADEPTKDSPVTAVEDDAQGDAFCCHGCRKAYEFIHGLGLENFYDLRRQSSAQAGSTAIESSGRYSQFDDLAFLGLSAPVALESGLNEVTLAVQGLHCAACSWLIENALGAQSGVASTRVRMNRHTLQVIYDPKQLQVSELAEFVGNLGYQLSPLRNDGEDQAEQDSRRLLIQIAIAGFLAANAMWIAIALYAGAESVTEYRRFMQLIGIALGLASVLGPGRTFLTGAWAALRNWTPHMDMPIALGLCVGSIVGTLNVVRGSGDVYFDSLTTLVFLLLIGRWIQMRQQHRAASAIDLMLRVTPQHAMRVLDDGKVAQVNVDVLSVGDTIQVLSGDCVPVDGTIERVGLNTEIDGQTHLDRSLLTGESRPVAARQNDAISAGVINLGPPIFVAVAATGADSRVGKIMRTVESAAQDRIPIVMLADRIGAYFVVIVSLLAMMTFGLWFNTELDVAVGHATALLIVACPCALALATPLAIAVSLARAAKHGIFVRDGSVLQRVAKPGRIWLDKTGTLTEGKLRVTSVQGDHEALRLAASLEKSSRHPVAQAIVLEAQNRRLTLSHRAKIESNVDKKQVGGIHGQVDGRSVVVGNRSYCESHDIELTPTTLNQIAALAQGSDSDAASGRELAVGQSPLLIAIDGQVECVLGLSDPIRAGAAETISKLQGLGWRVGLLSGDHAEIAQQVGLRLGISPEDCLGAKSPEEKLAIVQQSRRDSQTAIMVGDGANDAAALAAADVGIAVRGGAEVSLEAAPVFVARDQLNSIVRLIRGGARTHRLILSTFAISLAYNCIAVVLAMGGYINPLAAAILMPISSVSVLAWTLSSKTFSEDSI